MEEKAGIAVSDNFLNRTLRAQALRSTINKWEFVKLRNFCTAEDTIIQTKHQPTEWKKILTNYISDRGLISKTYKELKRLNIKKTNLLILKWATDLNREFSEEKTQMAERRLKKCSTSLTISEVQIKTTLRFHRTPARIGRINRTSDMWSKRNTQTWLVGVQIHIATVEIRVAIPQEAGNRIYFKIQLYHPWAYNQRIVHPATETLPQTLVHCFSIYNSQILETT